MTLWIKAQYNRHGLTSQDNRKHYYYHTPYVIAHRLISIFVQMVSYPQNPDHPKTPIIDHVSPGGRLTMVVLYITFKFNLDREHTNYKTNWS